MTSVPRIALTVTKKDLENPLFKSLVDEWAADKGSRDSQRPIKDSLLVGMALKTLKISPMILQAHESGVLDQIANDPIRMRVIIELLLGHSFDQISSSGAAGLAPHTPSLTAIVSPAKTDQALQMVPSQQSNSTLSETQSESTFSATGMKEQISS